MRLSWAAIISLGLLVTACGGGGGGSDKSERLPGTRISVIGLEEGVEVDPAMRGVEVVLPKPYVNDAWPQSGGYASHAMHHLALSTSPQRVWRTDIGAGSESTRRIVSQPVVANGVVYASDSEWGVSATDARTGDRLWRVELEDKEEKKDSAMGGGVAYHDGRVYVTSGVGFAAALDARSGQELWRVPFEVALRGAPTVADGQVYVITHDNQLFALEADTGDQLWSFVAIAEAAGMLGAASPAVSGDVVVAAFSSGELIALRADNGNAVWRDSLTRTGRMTALSTLNDIDGHPVIDRGLVFGVGHSGRMAAIDLRSGERVWENNISSLQTPWVAGDFVYVVTLDSKVVCIGRESGRVRWIAELQRFKKNKKDKPAIVWSGPVLAGDRLVLVSNHGFAVSLSPYNGDFLGAIEIPDKSFISPVVANETLYILTRDAELTALR